MAYRWGLPVILQSVACEEVDESHGGVVSASVDDGVRRFGAGGEEAGPAYRAAGLGAEPGVDAVRVKTVAAQRQRLHLVPGHERGDADGALPLVHATVALLSGGRRAVERDWQSIDCVGVEAREHGRRRRGGRRGGGGLAVSAAAARPAEVEADGDEGDDEGEQAGQQRDGAAVQREVAVVDVAVPHPRHLVRRPRRGLLRRQYNQQGKHHQQHQVQHLQHGQQQEGTVQVQHIQQEQQVQEDPMQLPLENFQTMLAEQGVPFYAGLPLPATISLIAVFKHIMMLLWTLLQIHLKRRLICRLPQ